MVLGAFFILTLDQATIPGALITAAVTILAEPLVTRPAFAGTTSVMVFT